MTTIKPVGFSKSQLGGLAVEAETEDKVFLIYGILEDKMSISGFDYRFKADGDVVLSKDWELRHSDPKLHSALSKEVSAICREFSLKELAGRVEYLDDLIFTKGVANTLSLCKSRDQDFHLPIIERLDQIEDSFKKNFDLSEEDVSFLESIKD